jgi:hypothetical protein
MPFPEERQYLQEYKPNRTELIFSEDNLYDLTTIHIVIPVKNNQYGINKILTSFFEKVVDKDKPHNITIVDNNSDVPLIISAEQHALAQAFGTKINLLSCAAIGPAAARNVGWRFAVANGAQWVLFVDSDCVFTAATISNFNSNLDGSVAYQGLILALDKDWLSAWYDKLNLLNPFLIADPYDNKMRPNFISTSNVLIYKDALLKTGGFNESFKYAAIEDVYFGGMLMDIGTIANVPSAVIEHDFLNGSETVKCANIHDMIKRFERYGNGMYTLITIRGAECVKLPDYDGLEKRYKEFRESLVVRNPEDLFEEQSDANLGLMAHGALIYGYKVALTAANGATVQANMAKLTLTM